MSTAWQHLIERLESAEGPDRNLDIRLGQLIGYTRKLGVPNADGEAKVTVQWRLPSGHVGSLPMFTASIQAAWEFAASFCEGANPIAFTFEADGTANAQVGELQVFQMPTPALALCVVALRARLENG